jgi:hypothetical protein
MCAAAVSRLPRRGSVRRIVGGRLSWRNGGVEEGREEGKGESSVRHGFTWLRAYFCLQCAVFVITTYNKFTGTAVWELLTHLSLVMGFKVLAVAAAVLAGKL